MVVRLSDDFRVMGRLFQILGTATEKERFPRLSLVLGTKSCCEKGK